MTRVIISTFMCLVTSLGAYADVTIEDCVAKAEANYPLISKYRLVEQTAEIDLSDINRSWLPRVGVYGQGTWQNTVPQFPEVLSGVIHQMGQEIKGLSKTQYKVGVDLSQTIWDGGTSHNRREVTRAQQSVQESALDVELYAVRKRVENLYFATLLAEEQIAQNQVTLDLLKSNLGRLRSMLRNGTAMQSDVDMIEAQILQLNQGIIQARNMAESSRKMLGLYVGESLDGEKLLEPDATMPDNMQPDRPELRLFDRQLAANDAALRLTDSSVMPKVQLFAQAYYGYPGLNYFKSMTDRNMTFNLLAGVKVAWNIDSFYTRRNSASRSSLNAQSIRADREVFLFNSKIQTSSQLDAINSLRALMKDDKEIIALRANVRKAAESQLANGIIDATALLTKISDENMAALTAKLHEIQLLQEIYNLKYTLNR